MTDPDDADPREASAALENLGRAVLECRHASRKIVESALARPFRSVGIVGAGIMGSAIAVAHAARAIPVVIVDTNSEALQRAAMQSASDLASIPGAGNSKDRQPISFSSQLDALRGCDLVIESIAEKRPAKQALYASLAPHIDPDTVLATNTSSIPIGRLASGLANPAAFCGLHFCHPVRLRPLIEIVAGAATGPATLAALVAHATRLGKLPLVVGDGPGFVVNRLLLTYLNHALRLVTEGVAIEQIDRAMVDFGMTLGPLELLDEIGLDTALHSGIVLSEIFGDRTPGIEFLVRMVKAKQNGMKAGAGFYAYPEKSKNPLLDGFLEEAGRSNALAAEAPARGTIAGRLLSPMATEARRLLEEGKASAPWQIDIATIFGLGFPQWRGGLLWWAEHGGAKFF